MLVTAALAGGEASDAVRGELCAARNGVMRAWEDRFAAALAAGETLPAAPAALARYVMAVSNGMTVMARSGATPADLRGVAETAMRAWPESSP